LHTSSYTVLTQFFSRELRDGANGLRAINRAINKVTARSSSAKAVEAWCVAFQLRKPIRPQYAG